MSGSTCESGSGAQATKAPAKASSNPKNDDANEDRNVLTTIDRAGGSETIPVEDAYQKKSHLEHILLRPDSYIGSIEHNEKKPMWVYNMKDSKLEQRDPKMNTIKITINTEKNEISVYNNGKGIPVTQHKVEKVYVPELIFGALLTSYNYNDDEKKLTGGRNGYGAKLCNLFSTKVTLETSSVDYKSAFKQTWINNMTRDEEPTIVPSTDEDFTKITFSPDLAKFKTKELDDDICHLMARRAYDVAGSCKGVAVSLNGKRIPIK
nr:hypothetical protein F32A11.5 - Caenorhabditis elegans [Caenorhabditis elegans]